MHNSSSDPRPSGARPHRRCTIPALTPGARTLALFALLTVALAAGAQPAGSGGINRPEHRDKPHVVLISLDGFKPEYLERFDLPTLKRLAARGARAKAMQPVFPSLTFPNHYSLVTGLESAKHGIVSNRFFDPARKDSYVYTDSQKVTDGSWYGGEPIWVTAETQGMVAACYFWPGSEAAIKGVRPTIYTTYSTEVPNEARVKTVLEWLQMPAERRPHLITLYFSDLDTASHAGALDHPRVEAAAKSLDTLIGTLVAGLDALPLRDRVYLLITSDHGMVETSAKQTVALASVIDAADLTDIQASFAGPVANIHVRGGAARAEELQMKMSGRLQHGKAYLRQQLPERFRHSTNPRSGDIVVVMDEGWTMSVPRAGAPSTPPPVATTEQRQPPRPSGEGRGQHGWDPELPSMQALFLAVGPTIRPGVVVDKVHNVDVYPLMAELLGLKPAEQIDGRAGHIRKLIAR